MTESYANSTAQTLDISLDRCTIWGMNTTNETLAETYARIRAQEVERFGHFPKRTMYGRNCTECGRLVITSSDGLRHSREA